MPIFDVVVEKNDGTLIYSRKEIESSAIKSAKAYIAFRKEKRALVLAGNKVVFSLPDIAKNDKAFVAAAIAKTHQEPTVNPSSPPVKPTILRPIDQLAKEYDVAMKKGIKIPGEIAKKTRPCDIEVLESSCLTFALSRSTPLKAARELCEKNKDEISSLANQMTQGTLSKEDAIEALISFMQGKSPMTTINPVENKPSGPGIDVSKVTRGKKGSNFPKTKIREDLLISDEEFEMDEPTSLPNGIVIYTTKESDDKVHEILAGALGYSPSGWINAHRPSDILGYDYVKTLSLSRPSVKFPRWTALGGRMQKPTVFLQKLKEEVPDYESKVKVAIAQGIELE